jgi:hypothetical protein
MPQRMWKHSCALGGGTSWRGDRDRCGECGEAYVYDGWHLGMHEAMARYQAMYGLKPVGPHRELAHELLGPLSVRCDNCSGDSLITNYDEDTWSLCPRCQGLGFVRIVPPKEIAAARERVLQSFPDAAVSATPEEYAAWLRGSEAEYRRDFLQRRH